MLGVGLTAVRKTTGIPLVMPPLICPLLVGDSRDAHRIALHAEGIVGLRPFRSAESRPVPNSMPPQRAPKTPPMMEISHQAGASAHTGGQAENGCFKVTLTLSPSRTGTDGRFHRLFDGSIQQGEALVLTTVPERPVRQRRPAQGIGNAGTAGDVGGDVDAGAVQRTQHDGTACQRGSDAAEKWPTRAS